MMRYLLTLCILCSASLFGTAYHPENMWQDYFAYQKQDTPKLSSEGSRSFFKQWFMGPLLVPSPINAAPNKPSFEPSVTATCTYGDFTSHGKIHKRPIATWSVLYDAYMQVGFNKYLGIDLIANLLSNYTREASYTHFTDTIVRLGFQISRDKHIKGDWTPDCRLAFQEIFPTGKYQRLKPSRGGIDITGQGSFQSGLYLTFEKGFKFHTQHAYNLYASFGYILPANFRVKRHNLYGGNRLTDGKVRPGSVFSVFLSGEFEISKHISIAYDSNYQQSLSGTFTGRQGIGALVDVPQIITFSVAAPEIEITLTENTGIMVGPWFTVAGQNSPSFAAFFVAFLMFF